MVPLVYVVLGAVSVQRAAFAETAAAREAARAYATAGSDDLGERRADVIISNPPYLPTSLIAALAPEVRQYDPRGALDGGPDGLRVIRRIVAEAPQRLVPGGALVLETSGDEQVRAVVALMEKAGFGVVETRRDLAGVERFVAGKRR